MVACTHHLLGMLAMQWRRGGKNHRIGPLNTLAEISGMMRDCILPGDLRGILLITTHEARDFHARYALESIEVLLTEGTLSCHADPNTRELLWVLAQLVEESRVPLAVDQARPRPTDLVREAAGPEDDDVQVLRIGFHRLADRFAPHVAAVPRRRRIHDDVDGQRDDRARPLVLGLAEQKVERHR